MHSSSRYSPTSYKELSHDIPTESYVPFLVPHAAVENICGPLLPEEPTQIYLGERGIVDIPQGGVERISDNVREAEGILSATGEQVRVAVFKRSALRRFLTWALAEGSQASVVAELRPPHGGDQVID